MPLFRRHRKQAVLVAPLDICGIYACLTRSFRELGHKADFLNFHVDKNGAWDNSQSDLLIRLLPKYHRAVNEYELTGNTKLNLFSKIRLVFVTALFFCWILFRYDIFILKSGEFVTFFGLEFILLRLFRKKVVSIFQGSDSRPPYLRPLSSFDTAENLLEQVHATQRRVRKAEKYSDVIINNPLTSQNHVRKVCLYQFVGIMVDKVKLDGGGQEVSPTVSHDAEKIRILHCPSYRAIKGTHEIRETVKQLQREFDNIVYIELSGVSNDVILAEIGLADIAVDQLYSDTDAATFATECCALGTAVVVGSYGVAALRSTVPGVAMAPTVLIDPERLEPTLRALIEDADFRTAASAAGKRYYEEFKDPAISAKRLLSIVNGEAPESWFFNPLDIVYVEGIGGNRETIAANVGRVLDHAGPEGLLMDHHPKLRAAIMAFYARYGKHAS